MDDINDKLLSAYTTYTMHTNYRIENLKIKNYKIGTNIFLLHFIDLNENCNMKSIAELLNITPSTATKKIDKLVRLGFIKRVSHEEDRRNVFLALTDKGKEISKEFFEIKYTNMQKILDQLSEEEKVIFLGILKKIILTKGDFTF